MVLFDLLDVHETIVSAFIETTVCPPGRRRHVDSIGDPGFAFSSSM
jgi:hypothetical protein